MANIVERRGKDGQVTSYQVRWREGGGRTGGGIQTERFEDRTAAEIFKGAVDEAGQHWPAGWVKGRGLVTPGQDNDDDQQYRFRVYARQCIDNRTGIEEYYREACHRELERHIYPTFGECDVRSSEHFCKATVSAWVRRLEQTLVWKGGDRRPMSPKTIKNLHGLLSSILNEAVQAEPPLRERNPCSLTRLGRTDDAGRLEAGDVDEGEDEDICFLTPAEVDGLVSCLARPEDRALVRLKYATGLRWSEITALARRHIVDADGPAPKVKVVRAWKRKSKSQGGGHYLGKPKSKRGRRTIRIPRTTAGELADLGLDTMPHAQLLFRSTGARLPYSTFYDRWKAAVAAAHAEGLLPEWKAPTPHDIRHSHAAALLSDGRSLTYVQRRLGHESIQTTSDVYGHLLPEADDDAMATIESALAGGRPAAAPVAPAAAAGPSVHVAHLGGHAEGFWDRAHAELVAERWEQDTGDAVRVETWEAAWWQRQRPGGLRSVWARIPDRALVWVAGPAVYQPDGSAEEAGPVGARWLWEWEADYTTVPAASAVEPGGGSTTQARAWGVEEAAVREAYAQARAQALRVCGTSPFRGAVGG